MSLTIQRNHFHDLQHRNVYFNAIMVAYSEKPGRELTNELASLASCGMQNQFPFSRPPIVSAVVTPSHEYMAYINTLFKLVVFHFLQKA